MFEQVLPSSQNAPVQSEGHVHSNEQLVREQSPPFAHGFGSQRLGPINK